MSQFAKQLQDIIRDPGNLVECANRCADAYNEANGYAYKPFGADEAETVAQNYAGLQAVVSGVTLICSQGGKALDEHGPPLLALVADSTCDDWTKDTMHRVANATWGAGQPFRLDKGPLGRADRVNVFDLLDPVEVAKDWVQIQTAAKFLVEKLGA